MGKISRFGLMELSRQRLRPSLSEGSHVTCPRCNGTGHIRDTESSALQVLRIIQEEAMKENSAAIHVQVPVDVAAFLLNEKRGEILKIETRHRVTAILIPNKHLETPHYKLDRLKHDDPRLEEAHVSYAMAEQADTDIGYNKRQKDDVKPRQEAVVKSITPETAPIVERKPAPAATNAAAASGGLFAGIAKFFSGLFGASEEKAPAVEDKPKHGRDKQGDRNRQRNRGRNGRDGRNGRGVDAEREERPANASRPEKDAKQTNGNDKNSTDAQARQPKQTRPPREEKEMQEPRRERQQRQRDNRKDNLNQEGKVEEVLNAATTASPAPAIAAPQMKSKVIEVNDTEAQVEAGSEPQAEEGRRRRRGGRNRNRRDRNSAENQDQNNAMNEGDDAKTDTPPAFIPVADLLNAKEATPVQASFDLAPSEVTSASVAAAPVAAPAAAPVETPVAAPAETPVEAAPVSEAPAQVSAIVAEVSAVVAEVKAEVSAETITQVTAVSTATIAANVVAEAPATASTTAIETSAAVEVATTAPVAVVNEVAEVMEEPASYVVTPVKTVATPRPVEDLSQVLASAGLVLASTDPAKLKAAQASTADIAPAPRVVRERKPAPSFEGEALVMVETKKD